MFGLEFRRKGLCGLEGVLLRAQGASSEPLACLRAWLSRAQRLADLVSSFLLWDSVVPSLLSLGSHLSRTVSWLPDKAWPHISVLGSLPYPLRKLPSN